MKIKKLVALAVAVAATAIVGITAASAETYGDFEYEILDDGTVEITDYTGDDTQLAIPNKINGKSVTAIGEGAFDWCRSLESITIPDSVTSIGVSAFFYCESLESVTIGDSVRSIGDRAFSYCESLESITIPDSVRSIGERTFDSCDSLESINVSTGNQHFSSEDGCLFNKEKTELIQYPIGNTRISYTIPDSVTSIDYAFFGCSSLESITIPDSVTSIGDYAFFGCSSLESITIPDSVTSIGDYAFCYCTSFESIIIPDSVKTIGHYAFCFCASLESVTISDSVRSIGHYAFGYTCNKETGEYFVIDGFEISCYEGSAAEKYAKENGFAYKIIDKSGKNLVVAIAVGAVAVIAVVVIKKKKQKTAE